LAKFVGVVPSASDLAGLAGLRTALVSGAALVLLVTLASPADAQYRRMGYGGYGGYGGFYAPSVNVQPRRARSVRSARSEGSSKSEKAEVKKDSGFGEIPKGPQQIVINMTAQKVTLYANGVRVAQGPVSTGVPGHPTPQGVFSVIEKDRYHHSNIYSGAPMPFMQRITWSGIAMHEGVVPGHPASHGCIRLTHDFAQKLWPTTKLGVRVIVSRHDVEPVEFQHAKLFVPKPKPAEPKVAMNGATDGMGIKLAQASPLAASDAPAVATESTQSAPAAMDGNKALAPVAAEPKSEPKSESKSEPKSAESAPVETVKPAADVKAAEVAPPAEPVTTDEPVKATGTVAPAQPAAAPAPLPPAELRKSVEAPAEAPKPAQATPAQATPAAAPAEAMPADDFVKPAPTEEPAKPAVAPRPKSADQPAKLSGQIAVFVSRKEKKIFVRQSTVPLFEMPITFDEPDKPLGTHVFTAMSVTDNGAGMRWNLMTIPTDTVAMMEDRSSRRKARDREPPKPVVHVQTKAASSAAEALDRVQFPQEAIDRISELLIPGSSLVISDAGVSHETGRATEFIVLTR
jgi:lipoprotein-anchoring transpeptidase ErfK/SrfK